MRKALAAVAFVLLVLSGTGALAKTKPTSICYHVSLAMWGSVIVPEQTVCVPCPIVGCPHLPVPPSIVQDKS